MAEMMDDGAEPETIRLDQFLKLAGAVGTGGQAKMLIQDGQVLVNGQVETRRRRQLRPGDIVEIDGEQWGVASDEDPPPDGERGASAF